MWSLQRRVVAGSVAWAVLTAVVGGYSMVTVFDNAANRSFNETLREQHLQLVVALTNANAPADIEAYLAVPHYQRTYSGKYWQVTNAHGQNYTSPSLFDFEFADSFEEGFWEAEGPNWYRSRL